MELREFARRVLLSESLAVKLAPPALPLSDRQPGPPLAIDNPARPAHLRFALRRTAPRMPHPAALHSWVKRAVAHHIMANHELQALEVMAWVLLAFPEAPPEFRQGVASVMGDEQRHTRMHIRRLEDLGLGFGDLPVNDYIWRKSRSFAGLLDYLAGLPLTFEGRNLDHTLEFEAYFRDVGDENSAAVMRAIHDDEIRHVAFGLQWLRKLKPAGQSDWDAYCAHLHWPLRPEKAVGDRFDRSSRRAAGLDAEFIERLAGAAQQTTGVE